MSFFRRGTCRSLVLGVLAGLTSCQSRPPAGETKAAPHAAPATPSGGAAPTVEELRGATITGIEEAAGPVTLANGRWEGKPFVDGGASVPSVTLVRDFRLTGDLTGDAAEDAAVLLAAGTGGTGETIYLAVIGRDRAQIRSVAIAPVGDRVQVRDGRIDGRRIVLDVVQAGAEDAMCCPGDLVTRSWELGEGGLKEGAPAPAGRLSVETLAGAEWVLRAWAWDEAAPAQPEVTLRLDGGRFAGSAGCNHYFGPATPGAQPGELQIGPVGATRKMCPEPEMAVETRYLQQLGGVQQMRFVGGRLGLTYATKDGGRGTMLFERRAAQ